MWIKFIKLTEGIPPTKYWLMDFYQKSMYSEELNKFCWHTKLSCIDYVPSELLEECTDPENYQDIKDIFIRIQNAKDRGEL